MERIIFIAGNLTLEKRARRTGRGGIYLSIGGGESAVVFVVHRLEALVARCSIPKLCSSSYFYVRRQHRETTSPEPFVQTRRTRCTAEIVG